MTGAFRHGPVAGWPSPSATDGPTASAPSSKRVSTKLQYCIMPLTYMLPAPSSKHCLLACFVIQAALSEGKNMSSVTLDSMLLKVQLFVLAPLNHVVASV